MNLTPEYLSIQGKVFIHRRSAAGLPLAGLWLGDMSAVTFGFEENATTYKENYTGKRATSLKVTDEVVNSFQGTLLQLCAATINALFRAEEVVQSTTPVTGRVISGDTLLDGEFYSLGHSNVSAVSVEDSTGTPVVLVANTDYRLDAVGGQVELLDGTALTGPLKADFTPGASKSAKLLTGANEDWWIKFVGVNTVKNDAPGVVELYKVSLNLPASFGLVHDTRMEETLSGVPQIDALQSAAGPLGQLGRISGFGLFD